MSYRVRFPGYLPYDGLNRCGGRDREQGCHESARDAAQPAANGRAGQHRDKDKRGLTRTGLLIRRAVADAGVMLRPSSGIEETMSVPVWKCRRSGEDWDVWST